MEIDKIGLTPASVQSPKVPPEQHSPVGSSQEPRVHRGQDEVSLSETAQEMQRAWRAANAALDVRPEKVAALRKSLQEGTYNVPDDVLLDKIIQGWGYGR